MVALVFEWIKQCTPVALFSCLSCISWLNESDKSCITDAFKYTLWNVNGRSLHVCTAASGPVGRWLQEPLRHGRGQQQDRHAANFFAAFPGRKPALRYAKTLRDATLTNFWIPTASAYLRSHKMSDSHKYVLCRRFSFTSIMLLNWIFVHPP